MTVTTTAEAAPTDDLRTPAERDWYARHGAEHTHCPRGCSHPQEALTTDGRMICLSCWVREGVVTEVVPCVPGVCE